MKRSTRLAFRWVRGLTGWTRCAAGDPVADLEVPGEDDVGGVYDDVPES